MIVRRRCGFGVAVWIMQFSLSATSVFAQRTAPPLDAIAVRNALIPRINDGTFRGLATAWTDRDSLHLATAGVVSSNGAAIDPTTRFELGELSEVFVAALLANLVVRGELSLDDPAQRFLPKHIQLPVQNGRQITLGDLAFHRSGLPNTRIFAAGSPSEQISLALRASRLRFDIGSAYAFSQLGTDVLGYALAQHLRAPLTQAITSHIFAPLGITDITVSAARVGDTHTAAGHALSGVRISGRRTFSAWMGSITGVTRFSMAASDTIRGPLATTFALMMRTRSRGPDPTLPVALGWRLLLLDGRELYWHDAQDAPGFAAYAVIDPRRGRVAAVLSNTAHAVDAIAGQLLLGRAPVIAAASRAAIATPSRRATSRRPSRSPSRRRVRRT
jgi:serine-type D-Ala-D-Ala carboxypeptidase/endopeptidase